MRSRPNSSTGLSVLRGVLLLIGLQASGWGVAQGLAEGAGATGGSAATSTARRADFARVDQALLDAARHTRQAQRSAALREAQVLLDAVQASLSRSAALAGAAPPLGASGVRELSRELEALDAYQDRTEVELRESLMHMVWRTPGPQGAPVGLVDIGHVSDALRVIRALEAFGEQSERALSAGLDGLRAHYWALLEAHARATDPAWSGAPGSPFDRRISIDDDGVPLIYELVANADRTVRWRPATAAVVAPALLAQGALGLDLHSESAAWLLIVEGHDPRALLERHALWLESAGEGLRLLLRAPAVNQPLLTRYLEDERPLALTPYLMPPREAGAEVEMVTLVHTASRRVLGQWPLSVLLGERSDATVAYINQLLTVAER